MKNSIFSMIVCFLPLCVTAQHFDAGIGLGVSNYTGDLTSDSRRFYGQNTGLGASGFLRYNFSYLGAVRLQAAYLQLEGSDAISSIESVRARNLSFQTSVTELSLIGELNLPGYAPYNLAMPLSPYIFAGIAAFSFNPTADYNGEQVRLQPLGTEGQGLPDRPEPYSRTSISIPMGLGIKYAVTDKLNVGLEVGTRLAFTDYLDDVSGTYMSHPELLAGNGELAAALGNRSGELLGGEPIVAPTGTQRGDNHRRDWYLMAGLTVSWNFLDNGLVGSRARYRKKAGCPG
jgi:opacity protein-like surface antigen